MAIVARTLVRGRKSFWVCARFEGRPYWHHAGHTRAQAESLEEFINSQIAAGRYVPKLDESLIYNSLLPIDVPGVYAVAGVPGYVKIGCARQSVAYRMRELQIAHPVKLRLLAILHDDPAMEPLFHGRFAAWRSLGEWFFLSPPIIGAINSANELALQQAADSAKETA